MGAGQSLTDLDTVSSELGEVAGGREMSDLEIDFHLHETETRSAASEQQESHGKPKGILKNSRTAENFRFYSNPQLGTAHENRNTNHRLLNSEY